MKNYWLNRYKFIIFDIDRHALLKEAYQALVLVIASKANLDDVTLAMSTILMELLSNHPLWDGNDNSITFRNGIKWTIIEAESYPKDLIGIRKETKKESE